MGRALPCDSVVTARVADFAAGYVLFSSSPAPLATHTERIARPFGRTPSAVVPTGGVR